MRSELRPEAANTIIRDGGANGAVSRIKQLSGGNPVHLPPALFIDGEHLLPKHAAAEVLEATSHTEPAMIAYHCDQVILAGPRKLVIGDGFTIWNRQRGDEIRRPDPKIDRPIQGSEGEWFVDLTNAERLSGRHFLLSCDTSDMYHHWMLDCLPRALALLSDPEFDDVHFMVSKLAPRYVTTSLELLGFPPDRLSFFDADLLTIVDQMVLVPTPTYGRSGCAWSCLSALRARMLEAPAFKAMVSGRPVGQRVLLTRRDAPSAPRLLMNESDLVRAFVADGYVAIEPGNLSVIEQVALVYTASSVACVHGSAGANLLFGGADTTALHLFPECVHYFHAHGYASAAAGSPYAYCYGASFQRRIRYHNNPWLIDPQRAVAAAQRLRKVRS